MALSAVIANLVTRLSIDAADFTSGISQAQKRLTNVGASLTRLGSDLTQTISLPLAAAGGAVVKFGSDFESAFAGVKKTVSGTPEQLQSIRDGLRDMAKEIPVSAEGLSAIAENAGQLGIQTDNVLEFTRVVADLGATTNLSTDEASAGLAKLSNILGTSQKDFDRLGSTIVDLGNNFATTERDILAMSLNLASSGRQIGLTEPQVLAFATALSSVGLEADAGGHAISRVFVEIEKSVATGNKNLSLFARVAGESVSDFSKSFKTDAAGAVVAFIQGLKRVQDSGQSVSVVLDALGLDNIRVADALKRSALAGDLLTNALGRGSNAWKENTALTREAAQRYETFASKVQVLWQRIRDVFITLFDAVRPLLVDTVIPLFEKLVETLAAAARAFAQLPQPVQAAAVAILALAAAIGPLLIIAGKVVFSVKNIISLFGSFAAPAAAAAAATGEVGAAAAATATAAGGLSGVLGGVAAFLTGPWGIAIAAAIAAYALFGDEIKEGIVRLTNWLGITNSVTPKIIDLATGTDSASKNFRKLSDQLLLNAEDLYAITRAGEEATQKFRDHREEINKLRDSMVAGSITYEDYVQKIKDLIGLNAPKAFEEIRAKANELKEELASGKITAEQYEQAIYKIDAANKKAEQSTFFWTDRLNNLWDAFKRGPFNLPSGTGSVFDQSGNLQSTFERPGGDIQSGGLGGGPADIAIGAITRLVQAWREAGVVIPNSSLDIARAAKEAADGMRNAAETGHGILVPGLKEVEEAANKASGTGGGGGGGGGLGGLGTKVDSLKESFLNSLNPLRSLNTDIADLAKKGFDAKQIAIVYGQRLLDAARAEEEAAKFAKLLGLELPVTELNAAAAAAKKYAEEWLRAQKIAALVKESNDRLNKSIKDGTGLVDAHIESNITLSQRTLDVFSSLEKQRKEFDANIISLRELTGQGISAEDAFKSLGLTGDGVIETAKRFGIVLDENTAALVRQQLGIEENKRQAEQWRQAWTQAFGDVVSRFSKGISDMIFEGKRLSDSLQGIFKSLAKALVEILLQRLFSPVLKLFSKFADNLFGQLGNLFTGKGFSLKDVFDFKGLFKTATTVATGAATTAAATAASSAAVAGGIASSAGGTVLAAGAPELAALLADPLGLGIAASTAPAAAAAPTTAAATTGIFSQVGAFLTNPWTIAIGGALAAGIVIWRKYFVRNIGDVAKDIQRDFAVALDTNTLKQFARSVNVTDDTFKKFTKSISLSPAFFKFALDAGVSADALVKAFSSFEAFGTTHDFGAAAAAAAAGDYSQLNAAWLGLFQNSDQLQTALGGTFDSLLDHSAAAQQAADSVNEASDAAGDAIESVDSLGDSVDSLTDSFQNAGAAVFDLAEAIKSPDYAGVSDRLAATYEAALALRSISGGRFGEARAAAFEVFDQFGAEGLQSAVNQLLSSGTGGRSISAALLSAANSASIPSQSPGAAIIPSDSPGAAIERGLDRVVEAIESNGDITIEIVLDGQRIGRAVIPVIDREIAQVGPSGLTATIIRAVGRNSGGVTSQ